MIRITPKRPKGGGSGHLVPLVFGGARCLWDAFFSIPGSAFKGPCIPAPIARRYLVPSSRAVVSKTLMLGVLLSSVACGNAPQPSTSLASEARSRCGAPAGADYYFPLAAFQTKDNDGGELRREYSAFLHASKEDPLSCGSAASDQEFYRLIVLHPFLPTPRVVRLTRTKGDHQLVAIALIGDAAGRLEVGKRIVKAVSQEKWDEFTLVLGQSDFWFSPTYAVDAPFHQPVTLDASNWIFEGRKGSNYHVVVRFSTPDDPFSRLAELLLSAAGFEGMSR
jgi:hypothetical protein